VRRLQLLSCCRCALLAAGCSAATVFMPTGDVLVPQWCITFKGGHSDGRGGCYGRQGLHEIVATVRCREEGRRRRERVVSGDLCARMAWLAVVARTVVQQQGDNGSYRPLPSFLLTSLLADCTRDCVCCTVYVCAARLRWWAARSLTT
jgi:hypothetical protein